MATEGPPPEDTSKRARKLDMVSVLLDFVSTMVVLVGFAATSMQHLGDSTRIRAGMLAIFLFIQVTAGVFKISSMQMRLRQRRQVGGQPEVMVEVSVERPAQPPAIPPLRIAELAAKTIRVVTEKMTQAARGGGAA